MKFWGVFLFQDEKEQLLQYRSTVAGLVGRAKNIVQLKPRNPETPLRSSIPVKAICDYRQIEVMLFMSYPTTFPLICVLMILKPGHVL